MATTTNLNLKKPAYVDNGDVADINSNMDTIDALVGGTSMGTTATTLKGAIAEHSSSIGALNTKVGSTLLPTTAQTLTGAIAEQNTAIGGRARAIYIESTDTAQIIWNKISVLESYEATTIYIAKEAMAILSKGSRTSTGCAGVLTRATSGAFYFVGRYTATGIISFYMTNVTQANLASGDHSYTENDVSADIDTKGKYFYCNNSSTAESIYAKISTLTSGETASILFTTNAMSIISKGARAENLVGVISRSSSTAYQMVGRLPSNKVISCNINTAGEEDFLAGNHNYLENEMCVADNVAIVATSNVAPQSITSGKYVIYDGLLYKASSNIASGTSGTSFTNKLTAVTGGGLNTLNDAIGGVTDKIGGYEYIGSLGGASESTYTLDLPASSGSTHLYLVLAYRAGVNSTSQMAVYFLQTYINESNAYANLLTVGGSPTTLTLSASASTQTNKATVTLTTTASSEYAKIFKMF